MQYCPICMTLTLELSSRGVVNLLINGKQMDTGRFLYNLNKQSPEEIQAEFSAKLEEFFVWYKSFNNRKTISEVVLNSSDFVCNSGCVIDARRKLSVIDILIPKTYINSELLRLGEKYNITVELIARDEDSTF